MDDRLDDGPPFDQLNVGLQGDPHQAWIRAGAAQGDLSLIQGWLFGNEMVANDHRYDHPHDEQPPPALDDVKILL